MLRIVLKTALCLAVLLIVPAAALAYVVDVLSTANAGLSLLIGIYIWSPVILAAVIFSGPGEGHSSLGRLFAWAHFAERPQLRSQEHTPRIGDEELHHGPVSPSGQAFMIRSGEIRSAAVEGELETAT